MDHIILFRYQNGRVGFIQTDEGEGEMMVFDSMDDAVELATGHSLLQVISYQIVELDEL